MERHNNLAVSKNIQAHSSQSLPLRSNSFKPIRQQYRNQGKIRLLVPGTRVENKLMGEPHEKVMDKAGAVAHDTMEKVQQVTGEAKRAAQKEAEYQGLIQ